MAKENQQCWEQKHLLGKAGQHASKGRICRSARASQYYCPEHVLGCCQRQPHVLHQRSPNSLNNFVLLLPEGKRGKCFFLPAPFGIYQLHFLAVCLLLLTSFLENAFFHFWREGRRLLWDMGWSPNPVIWISSWHLKTTYIHARCLPSLKCHKALLSVLFSQQWLADVWGLMSLHAFHQYRNYTSCSLFFPYNGCCVLIYCV